MGMSDEPLQPLSVNVDGNTSSPSTTEGHAGDVDPWAPSTSKRVPKRKVHESLGFEGPSKRRKVTKENTGSLTVGKGKTNSKSGGRKRASAKVNARS
jgi:hypothetical protein